MDICNFERNIGVKMIAQKIHKFVELCRTSKTDFSYKMHPRGHETLYASCFAAMTLHYIGALPEPAEQQKWADYINSFQCSETGFFLGKEITEGRLMSEAHSKEHLLMHLCAHVLPALAVLGSKPKFNLKFAASYLDKQKLEAWFNARDWARVWIEGNNLLFMGQFITHIGEVEGQQEYIAELMLFYFDWLDELLDTKTGLWGTNLGSKLDVAIYGGYHQLLLYYYWKRPILYPERLVDSVLSIQHFDGGFGAWSDAGTCQNIDGIDILVNLYKLNDYRHRDIRRALRRVVRLILLKQTSNGGFVDRRGHFFDHMGMEYTQTPAGSANMFSTWFFTHALCLISEVLGDSFLRKLGLESNDFNSICSMGWHRKSMEMSTPSIATMERVFDAVEVCLRTLISEIYRRVKMKY